jgi:catechol 2,3-dioxygenase-like lactoylglutathione lyase family enzyme/ketosteroid isomerase-like protein
MIPWLALPQVQAIEGEVIFSESEILANNGREEQTAAVMAVVVSLWESYLYQDVEGYLSYLAPHISRLSERTGQFQQGKAALENDLPSEWEAFERPNDIIAEQMTLRDVELSFGEDGDTVFVLYWLEVEGGERWDYTDLGLVFQALTQTDGEWLLDYQLEAWGLEQEEETFTFDFVYPVSDLAAALDFYTPLLGEPEIVTDERASFNLQGARFWLDTDSLEDYISDKEGLPNGYAIFYVDDLREVRERLIDEEWGEVSEIFERGADEYILVLDPSQNVFLMMERDFSANDPAAEPSVSINPEPASLVEESAEAIFSAWMQMDTETLSDYSADDARWLDETQGLQADFIQTLPAQWAKYDYNDQGLVADWEAELLDTQALGEGDKIISTYAVTLTGFGTHPFVEKFYVALVFTGEEEFLYSFVLENDYTEAFVLALDYTGYPVADLDEAEDFYTQGLQLGDPYSDEDWWGYWSYNAVFGIYTADPESDGIPEAEGTNGYVSFWVYSAEDVYAYLEEQEVSFPIVESINKVSGLDEQPGYIQVYATDNEGNGVIFTEYTGRPR